MFFSSHVSSSDDLVERKQRIKKFKNEKKKKKVGCAG
jgi:hypothetical protein